MKCFLSRVLAITLLLVSLSIPTFAKAPISLDNLSKVGIDAISSEDSKILKSEIQNMTDKRFDSFITGYMKLETDRRVAKGKLNKLGVEVSFPQENLNNTQSWSASDITLNTYSAKRVNDSYYRLFCEFTGDSSESKPATYDVLGLFFDTSKASYYGYNSSDTNYVWLKDSSQFSNGTILFNVDDSKFGFRTEDEWAVIYVTKKSGSTGWFVYGDKYVHTYNTTSTSTSGSASVNFSGTGVSGSIGFSVNTSTVESSWEKGDDNAINFS